MRKKCCCKVRSDFLGGYKWLAATYGNIDLSCFLSAVKAHIQSLNKSTFFNLLLQRNYRVEEGPTEIRFQGLKGWSHDCKAGLQRLCELALAWGEGCISALAGDVTTHMCHLIQGLAHVWVCVLVRARICILLAKWQHFNCSSRICHALRQQESF